MKTEKRKKGLLILLAAAAMLLLAPLTAAADAISEKAGGNRPSSPDYITISGAADLTFTGNYHPDEKDGEEISGHDPFALFDTDCLRLKVETAGVLCVHVRIDSVPKTFCPEYVMSYLKEASRPFDDKSWMNSLKIGSDGDSMYFYTTRNGSGYGRFETFLEPGEYDLYSKCFGFESAYQYSIKFLPHEQNAPGTVLFQKPGAPYTLGQVFSGGINNGYRITSARTPFQNFGETCQHYLQFTVTKEWDYTIDLWANNGTSLGIEGQNAGVSVNYYAPSSLSDEVFDTYVTGVNIGKLQTFAHASEKVHLRPGTYTIRVAGLDQYVGCAPYVFTCYRFSISEAADNSLRKQQEITTGAASYNKQYGSKAFSLKAKTSGDGKLTFRSSNTKVAKVSSTGKVTPKAPGKAVITIKASDTPSCKAASAKVTVTVKLGTPSGFRVKSPSKKTIRASWKKTAKAAGYQVQYTSATTFNIMGWDGKSPDSLIAPAFGASGTKTITLKALNRKISKLVSKKTYYVRVRAYCKSGGKKVYSDWSKAVKIKVK